jgi:hypothetical protein
MIMPAMLVRWLGGIRGYLARKRAVDTYTLAKPVTLLLLLACGVSSHTWAAVAAAIMLVDLYSYLLGLVFLQRFYTEPASYRRSVLLLGVNFVEASLAFAVLYLFSGSIGHSGVPATSWGEVVYFSVITAATVGYGDLTPLTPVGRILVVFQVFASLFFVVVIVATFVGRLADKKKDRAA